MATMSHAATSPYRDDLAFIHDAGFGHVAQNAATELLEGSVPQTEDRSTASLCVVDLGCGKRNPGSGRSAAG